MYLCGLTHVSERARVCVCVYINFHHVTKGTEHAVAAVLLIALLLFCVFCCSDRSWFVNYV